ncbi:MAG: hypothetical protein AB3N20_18205 [Rhizobiaceae bacterium]
MHLPSSISVADKRGINQLPEFVAHGILGRDDGADYVETDDGSRVLMPEGIWEGYIIHWLGQRVRVQRLPQRDYSTGAKILLLAPDKPEPPKPYIELYYNESLPGYVSSMLGHFAINVDGRIFSFSETLNENEEMSVDEFFYRPALGEFSGHPDKLKFNVDDPDRPFYDKFGRRFMRTIHALRIEGLHTDRLTENLRTEIRTIHETPRDHGRPHKYRDFHYVRRSCTSIVRDALRDSGLREVSGVVPRELFLNSAYQVAKLHQSRSLKVQAKLMGQLKVPEKPYSRPNPVLNPVNRLRSPRLRRIPGMQAVLSR